MNKSLFALAIAALATISYDGLAHGPPQGKPTCEPGFQIVEETIYKDVERTVCKVVPDVKKVKKWVYSTKCEPFCIHSDGKKGFHGLKIGHCETGACTAECPDCQGPYTKKLLIKREVVEEVPTTKCVTEKVIETVACTVYRKVPCATTAPATTPADPMAQPLPKDAVQKKNPL